MSWDTLKEILVADYPGVALRPMHRLGILMEILPEMRAIDSLVVRDFYHRYTVDEHSLRTIEHLQALAEPPDARGTSFAPVWKMQERRDLLVLALLLHDTGKGMPVENHVQGSLTALASAASRLELSPEEEAEVRFLIEHHLDMSATVQRRDIFDPATVSAFAATVGTLERLQRLCCLLTYADIHAVNPEALTPWKAEMLWQLFVATANHVGRLRIVTACMPRTRVRCWSRFNPQPVARQKRKSSVFSRASRDATWPYILPQRLRSTSRYTENWAARHCRQN